MIIYVIRNVASGKAYVGQTVQKIDRRVGQHRYDSDSGRRQGLLAKSIRKHGWENFTVEVLEETDEAGLDMAERFWIKTYQSLAPHGYNLETGGNRNKRASEETRLKIGAASSNRSQETLRKIGDASRRRVISEEMRAKCSAASKLRKPMNGAQRAALSARKTGQRHSPESIELMKRVRSGSAKRGPENGNSRLDWATVRLIRVQRLTGRTLASIAGEHNIHMSQVSNIINNKQWVET
jgi:group I intron endonuclease